MENSAQPTVIPPAPEKPWYAEALPEHQWPRLLVYTLLGAEMPAWEQAQALLDNGFDLELSPDERHAEIIASPQDLENLRRLRYPTVVARDLLKS